MLPVIRHWLWLDHVLVITNMLWLWSCCIAGWIPKMKVWSCCIAGWIPKLKVWSCCTAGWIPKLKEETHSDGLGAWIKRDPPVCWSMGNKLRYWHRFSSTRHSNRPNNSCVTFSLTDQVGTHTHTRAHAHTHSLTHTHMHAHTRAHIHVHTHTSCALSLAPLEYTGWRPHPPDREARHISLKYWHKALSKSMLFSIR